MSGGMRIGARAAAALALCVGALPALGASSAAAIPLAPQDATVSAYLDRVEVGVGQVFTLNVELQGGQQFDEQPELPDMAAFAVFIRSGTQTSFQMANGRTTISLTAQYSFQATSEGTFEIGPVTVRAMGTAFTTEPLALTVSAAPPQPAPGSGSSPPPILAEDGNLAPDDLFIVAEPNVREVRENEPVIVEYRLYTRVDVNSYDVVQLPSTAGFWVEEFEQPRQPQVERLVRNGQQYASVVVRKVAMYPTGAGTKTIEPLAIEARVRLQRQSRDPFDDIFGGIFDRGSLFGDVLRSEAVSEPVTIEVRPLPADGRPASFTGLVGDLALETSADRDSLAANEALTWRLDVSGSGNLKALPPPEVDFPPTVEAFPPEVTDRFATTDRGVSGSRTYEYVLVPRAPGTLTIPGVEMGYFDAGPGRYATAVAPPLELRVTGREAGPSLPGARARGSVEELRSDIRFIRTDTPRFRQRGETLFDQAWFWIVALAPAGAVAGAAGVQRRRSRLAGDQAYARNRRAKRRAKKHLARAAALAGRDRAGQTYAEIARALEGFAADKLDMSAAGVIRDEVRAALAHRNVRSEVAEEFFAVLEECDRQRFAPAEGGPGELKAFLERAESALAALGQELR